ncbi:MAG TPA: anthranilate synthase component I family protein [Bacteroidetes bacterium]|nr:anthranilate synthase component I family protein [Bacteroidota bacterium]
MLADILTPVGIYLRLRDRFASPLLLESSDYHSKENSCSFLCFEPLFTLKGKGPQIELSSSLVSEVDISTRLPQGGELSDIFQNLMQPIDIQGEMLAVEQAGFFGHSNYDAVQQFESIRFTSQNKDNQIPDFQYSFYRFVIVINHFNDTLDLIEYREAGEESRLDEFQALVRSRSVAHHQFRREGEEKTPVTDEEYRELVRKGKHYCQKGEVFQIVFSRQFTQDFSGDEFNIYRALRSINPSPYLFYFDFGNYRLFGSSPEAQLVIDGGKAVIHPIAGTYRRSGEDQADAEAARQLAADPKENAEHVMLVDLARNDLSRNARAVTVAKYREPQFFSHVIHLVSEVQGQLATDANPIQIFGDTFPAGTLSGAPKYRAMQLIDQHEPVNRGFYGGAIGLVRLNGDLNHAIMIRSFMSHNHTLQYQAGAGIVVDSVPEKELQEVNNKLAALRQAMQMAETI